MLPHNRAKSQGWQSRKKLEARTSSCALLSLPVPVLASEVLLDLMVEELKGRCKKVGKLRQGVSEIIRSCDASVAAGDRVRTRVGRGVDLDFIIAEVKGGCQAI